MSLRLASLDLVRALGCIALLLPMLVYSGVAVPALPDLAGRKVVAVTENAYPPLNMIDGRTGKGQGWEYDVFNDIARRLNLAVDWRVCSWDALIESVRDGQFDVGMDGIAITEARRSQVDFSVPYMRADLIMLVRANESRFADPAGFRADRRLLAAAQAGTTSFYVTARALLGAEGTHPRMRLFETFGASIQALKAGDVDVVLADPTAARATMRLHPGTFKQIGTPLAGEDFGFVFRKGSPLVGPVNAALRQMIADGTLERLNRKWLAEPATRP